MQTQALYVIIKIHNGFIVEDPTNEVSTYCNDIQSVIEQIAGLAGDDIDAATALYGAYRAFQENAWTRLDKLKDLGPREVSVPESDEGEEAQYEE